MKNYKKIILLTPIMMFKSSICTDIPTIAKDQYKPLPSGQTYFSFTNYNNQNLSMTESKREIQTHISHQPPAPLQERITQPAPITNTTTNCPSDYTSWFKSLPHSLFSLQTGAFIVGTAAVTYTTALITLLRYAAKAKKNNGWGSFQEHIPLHHLQIVPQQTLAQGLLQEIQKQYQQANTNTLIHKALNDFERELEDLTAFLSYCQWLDYLKVSALFPNHNTLIARAKIKVQRLILFKEALENWVEEQTPRLLKNQETFSDSDVSLRTILASQDETDVMELPMYAL